jgi:hypothetical protein
MVGEVGGAYRCGVCENDISYAKHYKRSHVNYLSESKVNIEYALAKLMK